MNKFTKAVALATAFGSAVAVSPVIASGDYQDGGPGHCIYMGDYAIYAAKSRLDGASKSDLIESLPEANETFGIPSSLAGDVIDTLWDIDAQKIVFEPQDASRFAEKAIDVRKDGASMEAVMTAIPQLISGMGITENIASAIVEQVWALDSDKVQTENKALLAMNLDKVREVEMGLSDILSPSALRARVYMNCRSNYEDLVNELEFDDGVDIPTEAPKLDF